MNRRDFLRLLGLGAATTAAGIVLPQVEPVRRFWQVGRNAPVGPIETLGEWTSNNSGLIRLLSDPPFDPQDHLFAEASGGYPRWSFSDSPLTHEAIVRAEKMLEGLFGPVG